MIHSELIWVVDLVLVGGLLLGMLGAVGYAQPLVIGPLDGAVVGESEVVFSFERGERVLVDDNLLFSSPEIFLAGDIVALNPGTWYWMAEGALGLEGDVRSVTVQELVALEMRASGEGYEMVNVGNTKLRVGVYANETLVEERVVDTGMKSAFGSHITQIIGGKDD